MPRAQTTMDFLIGVTIFLFTLSAVLVSLPGLVDPFVTGEESHTITADRSAERLSMDVLVPAPDEPSTFDEAAVTGFFTKTPAQAKSILGIDTSVDLNITLSNATIRVHALGPEIPSNADSAVAWRSGRYRDEYAELVVRVW